MKTIKFYEECLEKGRYLLAQKLEWCMTRDTFELAADKVNNSRVWLYQTAAATGLMSLGELDRVREELEAFYGMQPSR